MIELDSLTKDFGGFRAVDGLTLSVAKGEVLGFLGPNGAGKSTTMKMLTGYLTPTSGTATIRGHDIVAARLKAQRLIGYLPEGAPGWPEMTARSMLQFAGRAHGLSGQELDEATASAMARTGLDHVAMQPIETLSKGFRRRVGLAVALQHDPDVLILDEPTDGLDPNQKQGVRHLISEISADKAIIVSTHILEEVEAVCSRAVIIARGKLLADGTPAELEARDPRHGAIRIGTGQADHDAAVAAIEKALPAASVEKEDAFRLLVRPGAAGPADVATALRDAGITPDEFTVLSGRLETVFRDITGASEDVKAEAA